MQETVRACARLRLILARPDLYIETVLDARRLLTVVAQVPIINFFEHFMSITRIPFPWFHFIYLSVYISCLGGTWCWVKLKLGGNKKPSYYVCARAWDLNRYRDDDFIIESGSWIVR